MSGEGGWDWSHNGLGGAPAWNWGGAPVGVDPLRLPASPLPEQREVIKEVEASAARRRFFAKHHWTPHLDPATGYEYWHNAR